jgi:hypothetical protein
MHDMERLRKGDRILDGDVGLQRLAALDEMEALDHM